MFPKHQSIYTFYQNSGALLIAIFGALSVADYKIVFAFLNSRNLADIICVINLYL